LKTKTRKIALVGNPNVGKTSLFNQLTGLNQKVGNFTGVTVERKSGDLTLANGETVEIIDLPGTYSLYPKSLDEEVVIDVLLHQQSPDFPDTVIVIVDVSNIERNLLLASQIIDLEIPVILALNMVELAEKKGFVYDKEILAQRLNCEVISINARTGLGIQELKLILQNTPSASSFIKYKFIEKYNEIITIIQKITHSSNTYQNWLVLNQVDKCRFLEDSLKVQIKDTLEKYHFEATQIQKMEILERYAQVKDILKASRQEKEPSQFYSLGQNIDKITLHPIGGYLVFATIMFVVFQSIFTLAEYPMNFIETTFISLSSYLQTHLPASKLTDLLTEGILAGIGGVVVFIPQIAILFGFISILEESGYMARVVFITDKMMQKFGLNGKSVIPLISGMACAIPAIMAARNIEDEKERLLTILVTPFMSCSARLPIYTLIISLIISDTPVLGIFSLKGFVLTGLYFLGIFAAIISAWFFQKVLNSSHKSYFLMEIPVYRMPRWRSIGLTMWQKSQEFVIEAGKVILAISIVLWGLASYAPDNEMEIIENEIIKEYPTLSETELEDKIASAKLEVSYAGQIGKFIEPVIRPLGYDWKIGIALLGSFAAREAFVGTMATIYSIESKGEEEATIRELLRQEKNPQTGEPLYTSALGFSLLVFYAFAMQCMGTVAVVYKETGSWKYPILQLVYMTGLAYISAFLAYNLL